MSSFPWWGEAVTINLPQVHSNIHCSSGVIMIQAFRNIEGCFTCLYKKNYVFAVLPHSVSSDIPSTYWSTFPAHSRPPVYPSKGCWWKIAASDCLTLRAEGEPAAHPPWANFECVSSPRWPQDDGDWWWLEYQQAPWRDYRGLNQSQQSSDPEVLGVKTPQTQLQIPAMEWTIVPGRWHTWWDQDNSSWRW